MKKYNFFSCRLLLVLGLTTVIFSSCGKDDAPLTFDEGVMINGVKWATRNVDAPGTFTAKPEDAGMFYQWNRKNAWLATGEKVTGWDNTWPACDTWGKPNDPSPAGWRVPTLGEIQTLLDTDKVSNEWITQNGIDGMKFIDKTTGNSIFLSATGCRYYGEGTLYLAGLCGCYWSSTQYDSYGACGLSFDSRKADWYYGYRSHGRSIRAVAE